MRVCDVLYLSLVLPPELSLEMEPSSYPPFGPINEHPDLLHGRIRATKHTNDSGTHTGSSSGKDARGDDRHSSLTNKGREGSLKYRDYEKSEEVAVSDTPSRIYPQRKC